MPTAPITPIRLAKDGRYEEALALLDTLKQQNTAKALNYRGYATRKLGRTDEGISYYLQSVKLDPQYAQVREYLGEAYVIKGRVDLAQEQLQQIKSICGTGCEEYQDLAEAIDDSVENLTINKRRPSSSAIRHSERNSDSIWRDCGATVCCCRAIAMWPRIWCRRHACARVGTGRLSMSPARAWIAGC
jgi:hypothetical protein